MSNTEKIPYKIYLDEKEMPKQWYNVRADMKNKPAPLLNPGTHEPMGFDDLRPVFATSLLSRSLTMTRLISTFPMRFSIFTKCTVRLLW